MRIYEDLRVVPFRFLIIVKARNAFEDPIVRA